MRMTVTEVMTTKIVSVTATTLFKTIAARMTGRVNGVVDVVDNLTWKYDDSEWEGK